MTLPDIDDLDAMGGALVDAFPVTDPTTDRAASAANVGYADAAAASHTVPRAIASFLMQSGPVFTATNPYDGTWPNTLANAPVVSRTAAGDYTITWPATVQDAIQIAQSSSNSHALNFRWAHGAIATVGQFGFVTAAVTGANAVRVQVRNTSGTLSDLTSCSVNVFVY